MTYYASITANLAAAQAMRNRGKSEIEKRAEAAGFTKEFESKLFNHVFELWGGSAIDAMSAGLLAYSDAVLAAEASGTLPDPLVAAQHGVQLERIDRYNQHPIMHFVARKLKTRAYRQSLGEF